MDTLADRGCTSYTTIPNTWGRTHRIHSLWKSRPAPLLHLPEAVSLVSPIGSLGLWGGACNLKPAWTLTSLTQLANFNWQFDSLKYWWKLEFLQLGVTSFCADPEMQRTWIQMGIPLLMMHLNKNVKRMQNMFSLLCCCDYYPQSEPRFEISGTTTGGFLTLCPHQILIFHVLYLILIFPPPPVHGRVNS